MADPPPAHLPDDSGRQLLERAAELERQCQYAAAEAMLREALQRELAGAPGEARARALSALAHNLLVQGKYAQAEALELEALAIRRSLFGDEHQEIAATCSNIAMNLRRQGRYAEAEILLRKALEVLRSLLTEQHPDTVKAMSNLALLLQDQGRHVEAERFLRRALDVRMQVFGRASLETAKSLHRLASCLEAQGLASDAEPLLRSLLRDYQAEVGDRHPDAAVAFYSLARNLHVQGRSAEAEPLLLQARAIVSEALGDRHPDLARCLRLVGEVRAALGDLAGAESCLREALGISSLALGEDHDESSACAQALGSCLHARGRDREAVDALQLALESFEAARRRVSHSPLDTVDFAAQRSPHTLLAACLARLGKHQEAWAALERCLARGLLEELAVRGDARRAEHPEAVCDLATIQASLARDAAVVAWVDCMAPPGAADDGGEHWAFVLRQAPMPPACIRLRGSGEQDRWTSEDDRLPDRLRELLSRPGTASSDLEALRSTSRQLREQRVAPIEPLLRAQGTLPAVRTLHVIPAGVMAEVPLAALVEDLSIGYVPSAALLARGSRREATTDPARRPPALLAVGAPAFAPGTQPPGAPAGRLAARRHLPASRQEVEAIAALFPPSSRQVLCGADASELQLAALAGSGRLASFTHLHFATHAEIEPRDPLRSSLWLACDALADPLELVLAGRQLCDGRLTAGEVLGAWKLDAELVVLSACETALGKAAGGEGFLGFVQAFLIAGARSVVVSLWKVDDRATALLMSRFYENLLVRGHARAPALAEARKWLRELSAESALSQLRGLPEAPASRGVLEEELESRAGPAGQPPYAHPYYWAGFVLFDVAAATGSPAS